MERTVSLFLLLACVLVVYAQNETEASDESTPCRKLLAEYRARKVVGGFSPQCDEEGNFKPVQRRGSSLFCSSKAGQNLAFTSHVSRGREKNCKCAVAQHESDQGRLGKKLVCDVHGNYEKVQCSDDSCYCTDPHGVKINNTENPITSFYAMNCGCSTAHYSFQQTGMVGLRFNCDSMGNYDNIQCRGSICYCVDSFGNELNETSRPISEYSSISCPERPPVSEVQPCKTKILKQLQRPNVPGVIHHSCDDDGYFNLVQMRGSMLLCVSPDGKYLGYPTRVGDAAASRKNCQCAADMYAKDPDYYVSVSTSCDRLGNYKPRQCNSFECYCVDLDGNRTDSNDC